VASIYKRYRVKVSGIVQGVGFRPFVYQLARELGLSGFVFNDGDGVVVEIEGEELSIQRFKEKLRTSSPPLSRIDSVDEQEVAVLGDTGFVIQESKQSSAETMVSPDIAVCDACREEMNDISNRRYHYPFINCTDCGPRYSIIESLPYDRPNTSMAAFSMCEACAKEYNDPNDRRYHAQPISCHDCGPRVSLLDLDGSVLAQDIEAVNRLCSLILHGKTVAIKGLGGFHLVCDATNEEAVAQLRRDKRRPTKPLAVMFDTIENAKRVSCLSDAEELLLCSKEHPIVVVQKNDENLLAPSVAPGIDRVGLFLAYTPLHILLLEKLGRPIVATSANLSDEPIITDEKTLLTKLGTVVHAVLSYDRKIVNACDDSVVMMAGSEKVMLRMARGYAPKSFLLPRKSSKKILALGANQKNTIALGFGDHMILSPHIGDLVSLDAVAYFERTLETFKRFDNFEPDIMVCDKHPGYETTLWAKDLVLDNRSIALIELQHHYAHALACMAEHGMDESVLAICFDGTGYGDDGTLWGGEVLIADTQEYKRIVHLRPFKLIGGEKAVKEPRRVALSLLFSCFTFDEIMQMDNPTVRSFDLAELKVLHTSIIDWEPMLKEILLSSSKADIATKFMNTVVQMIVDIAKKYSELPVVLSGGVFQNRYLVEKLVYHFTKEQIRYYIQHETPINDGGLALGQLYYAMHRRTDG
jgi:hydrogenase maturation protein HypF